MELIKNLRYMCRICAVNIKKRRSSSSAVSILETTQLTEKLKKYLNIDINNNDVLPKSICSVCYKKVEAIHALSALAKKTENFLTDFIKIAQNNLKQQVQSENFQSTYNDEFNQFALLDSSDCINDNDIICCEDDQRSSEAEEVVLNFTLNDPLTKNIQKKIVVAKQKKQEHLLNQRQQQQQREHKKYQHDLSQFSTSITPTTSTTTQQCKINSDNTTNELIRELKAFNKNRTELNNTSLEQKRQNLKKILNNNTGNNSTINQQPQNIQQQQNSISPESSTNSYKLIIPNAGNIGSHSTSNMNQTGGHSINVAVQIQQQPTPYSPHQHQSQSEFLQQLQQSQNVLINNNRAAQMMNDCLNLGSVIKDMDLLRLILKALKWPFNQETLNTQIQRLKSTRFRDVMVDPNLLQDTDLMQILSSYLSPILLQTSPSQTSNLSTTSLLTSANILPPSVSYKIPAETSVRLVCVPREEQQNEQQQHLNLNELQEKYQQTSQATISSSSLSTKNQQHQHSHNFDYKSSYEYQKSKKKNLKLTENYHRIQQQNCEPIIILSDDESHDESSDNIQKFEVNVDPMLYFNGADSSYENSNESTMITMGYFKHHQQQQQQLLQHHQGLTALKSEVTLQKRKKQKRKQTLIHNSTNKHILDQEILIVDENGEKPIQLNNEILCIPSKKLYNENDIPSTSKNYSNNDYLNMPTTSSNKKLNSDISNFEFTTPKKKRKLNTLKSSKERGLFALPKTKKKVPRSSDSMVIIHKPELSELEKFPLEQEIKLEKTFNDVSIIAVNKNYESTKKIETTNKPIVELMPKKQINDKSINLVDFEELLEKNIVKEQKGSQPKSNNLEKKSLVIDKIYKNAGEKDPVKQKETSKEISEIIDQENLKINEDDDADSVDTNGELVIDEGYDEEKLNDENKIDNNSEKQLELKSISNAGDCDPKFNSDLTTIGEVIANQNIDGTVRKTKGKLNLSEHNTLRRSRRQTKFKTPIMKSVRKNTNKIKKNLGTVGTNVVANVKKTVVSTRGKTRQHEQKTKMQTRNSNISQRGREQKPFTKYSKKK